MEFIVIDMGKGIYVHPNINLLHWFLLSFLNTSFLVLFSPGEPIGIYSAPLKEIAYEVRPGSSSHNSGFDLTWRDLSSAKRMVKY